MRNERSINILSSGKTISLEDYFLSLCKMLEAVGDPSEEAETTTVTEAA